MCFCCSYTATENNIHIKVGNSVSEQVRQHIGLRQGDNLSPNLFKLLLNDLSKCFDASDDQVELGNINVSCLLYANDFQRFNSEPTNLIAGALKESCRLYEHKKNVGCLAFILYLNI